MAIAHDVSRRPPLHHYCCQSKPQDTQLIAIHESMRAAVGLEPFPFRLNRNGALSLCFDAFSSCEPVSTPDQVRGRLSLENALVPNVRLAPANGHRQPG